MSIPAQPVRRACTRLHCELYNAALEERIDAWRKARKSISDYDHHSVLPQIRADRPELVELGSYALEQALRRLDLAFTVFFRRVKAGQTPGLDAVQIREAVLGLRLSRPGWMEAHAAWQERRNPAHRPWRSGLVLREVFQAPQSA